MSQYITPIKSATFRLCVALLLIAVLAMPIAVRVLGHRPATSTRGASYTVAMQIDDDATATTQVDIPQGNSFQSVGYTWGA